MTRPQILLSTLIGLLGFSLTTVLAYSNNTLITSFMRGLFGFGLMFALSFILFYFIDSISSNHNLPPSTDPLPSKGGVLVDFSPEAMSIATDQVDFRPLNISEVPKSQTIQKMKSEVTSEQVTEVVRTLLK